MTDQAQTRTDCEGSRSIAVCYLARGAEPGWQASIERFLDSYRRYACGIEHSLYVLSKGFASTADRHEVLRMFSGERHEVIELPDHNFDIGAYVAAARLLKEERLLMLNTHSEVLASDWVRKLNVNLDRPGVGLVGATGSFEQCVGEKRNQSWQPNVHVRTNAFMIDRQLWLDLAGTDVIRTKQDAYDFESGSRGLTRRVRARGLEALVVGRNGRGYSPQFWPRSETFRQGTQANLLIGDNQTRAYMAWPQPQKQSMAVATWGDRLVGTL